MKGIKQKTEHTKKSQAPSGPSEHCEVGKKWLYHMLII